MSDKTQAKWEANQRKAFRQGKLPLASIKKLEAIKGWSWITPNSEAHRWTEFAKGVVENYKNLHEFHDEIAYDIMKIVEDCDLHDSEAYLITKDLPELEWSKIWFVASNQISLQPFCYQNSTNYVREIEVRDGKIYDISFEPLDDLDIRSFALTHSNWHSTSAWEKFVKSEEFSKYKGFMPSYLAEFFRQSGSFDRVYPERKIVRDLGEDYEEFDAEDNFYDRLFSGVNNKKRMKLAMHGSKGAHLDEAEFHPQSWAMVNGLTRRATSTSHPRQPATFEQFCKLVRTFDWEDGKNLEAQWWGQIILDDHIGVDIPTNPKVFYGNLWWSWEHALLGAT